MVLLSATWLKSSCSDYPHASAHTLEIDDFNTAYIFGSHEQRDYGREGEKDRQAPGPHPVTLRDNDTYLIRLGVH